RQQREASHNDVHVALSSRESWFGVVIRKFSLSETIQMRDERLHPTQVPRHHRTGIRWRNCLFAANVANNSFEWRRVDPRESRYRLTHRNVVLCRHRTVQSYDAAEDYHDG